MPPALREPLPSLQATEALPHLAVPGPVRRSEGRCRKRGSLGQAASLLCVFRVFREKEKGSLFAIFSQG